MFIATQTFAQATTDAAATHPLIIQSVGMIVVVSCLAFIAIIVALSGKIIQTFGGSKKATPASTPKKTETITPTCSPIDELTNEEKIALAIAVDLAESGPTPQQVAAIAAAIEAVLGGGFNIVSIKPKAGSPWALAGRSEIFASHKIR